MLLIPFTLVLFRTLKYCSRKYQIRIQLRNLSVVRRMKEMKDMFMQLDEGNNKEVLRAPLQSFG